MAITVIGGVLLTTFLTLLVIPVVYAVLDRKSYPQAGNAPAPVPAEAPADVGQRQPRATHRRRHGIQQRGQPPRVDAREQWSEVAL